MTKKAKDKEDSKTEVKTDLDFTSPEPRKPDEANPPKDPTAARAARPKPEDRPEPPPAPAPGAVPFGSNTPGIAAPSERKN